MVEAKTAKKTTPSATFSTSQKVTRKTSVKKETIEGKLTLPVFNLKGEKIGRINLPEEVFGVKVNSPLLAQAVRIYQANLRQGNASTKTRAEVRGGGRKPWRQKGTGRARQGSIRSPQWRGGGVIFGPKPRDYSLSLPDKMKKAALKSALTSRLEDLVIVNEFKLKGHKTSQVGDALEKLNLSSRKTLLVLPEYDEALILASRNIPSVRLAKADELNALEVLSAGKLVFARDAVKKLGETDDTD